LFGLNKLFVGKSPKVTRCVLPQSFVPLNNLVFEIAIICNSGEKLSQRTSSIKCLFPIV